MKAVTGGENARERLSLPLVCGFQGARSPLEGPHAAGPGVRTARAVWGLPLRADTQGGR